MAAVLILIVMEDTHWVVAHFKLLQKDWVLILIVMEDTHWGIPTIGKEEDISVLILIVMEDTHWVWLKQPKPVYSWS